MIIVLLADGFEEIEALTPVDMLRRAGLDVKTVGMNGKIVCGSHKIPVICDLEPNEVDKDAVSMVIFPGGMPGSLNLDAHPFTDEIISAVTEKGGRLAAICAAPLVLGRRGLLKGKKATCYPGFEKELTGATALTDAVVTDGNITTSRGMGTALAFAKELVSLILGCDKANEISTSIMESATPSLQKDNGYSSNESSIIDERFIEILKFVSTKKKISTSLLQRSFGIGYGRASFYLDIMEDIGAVGTISGTKPRDVLMGEEQLQEMITKLREPCMINKLALLNAGKKEQPAAEKPDSNFDYDQIAKEAFERTYSDYNLPSLNTLFKRESNITTSVYTRELQETANKIIDTLAAFNLICSIIGATNGPRLMKFDIVPPRDTKLSKILNLCDELSLALGANSLRMEAPVPGKSTITIEVPRTDPEEVKLHDLMDTDEYRDNASDTIVCMGKDTENKPIYTDVAKMPHAIVAGALGMGKAVWFNAAMLSILGKAHPDKVKFILIDQKNVDFSIFESIPHLLFPIAKSVNQAENALKWAVEETDRRYNLFTAQAVRNIALYNDKVTNDPSIGKPMARIIIMINEIDDLMPIRDTSIESYITRIAQKARAAGIHMIIGTQRAKKESLTAIIRANIPSVFSFRLQSHLESKLLFDTSGAEKLLDKGDMLVNFATSIKPVRLQSAFVSDEEVSAFINGLKINSDTYNEKKELDNSIQSELDSAPSSADSKFIKDEKFLEAVDLALTTGRISTATIQRKLAIGYGRAAKLIDIMEDLGIVSEPDGAKPRYTLITAEEWRQKLAEVGIKLPDEGN